jgi:hypothetical protein
MSPQDEPKAMDSEDLGVELDKMDAAQRGVPMTVDQEKVQNDVEIFRRIAGAGQKQEAIDGLLAIEKQGRLAEDITSTRLACSSILQVWEVSHSDMWAYAKT